ncbi:Rv1733c family protein [Nonomuraea soli]|uniref:Transmembrane protein n=1 Tax=Nonomuraea soli TaxID=1032476 RepID=A0A7W0CF79_9ACTN|nr:hypothetical protein [Nonomuraea soli]MBA2890011.1 hypothetical protein [Nonomuraea soli]
MRRLIRLYLKRDNPLRRPSDRLEAMGVWMVVALIVLSLWPATWVAGLVAGQERADRGLRHQAEATLLQDAATLDLSFGEFTQQASDAEARWLSPSGEERGGRIPVLPTAVAGTTTTVWIDAGGELTAAPLDEPAVRLKAIHAGTFVVASVAATLCLVFLGFRWALNRRRYADWDAAWEQADTRRTP